jgi:hypothetical protein
MLSSNKLLRLCQIRRREKVAGARALGQFFLLVLVWLYWEFGYWYLGGFVKMNPGFLYALGGLINPLDTEVSDHN